jgi:hypothetical protein
MGLSLCNAFEKKTGPRLMPFQPSILPHRPCHQRHVEVPQDRIHRRWRKSSVILQPASEDWVVQPGDILQTQFRSISVVQLARRLPHRFERRRTNRRCEVHKQTVALAILHDPRSKGIPEKVELRIRIFPFATAVFAVDDLGLGWMQFQAALLKSGLKRLLDCLRFSLGPAMYEPVICIPTPGELWKRSLHPDIERIVQCSTSITFPVDDN